jgi:hypothetical protein
MLVSAPADTGPAWLSATGWNGLRSPAPHRSVGCHAQLRRRSSDLGAQGRPATLTAAPLASLTLLAALTGSDVFDRHLAVEDVVARHPLAIHTDPVHDVTRWAKGTRAAAEGDARNHPRFAAGDSILTGIPH